MKIKQAFAIALASAIIGCSTAPVMPQKPIEQIIAENIITPTDLTGIVYKLAKEEGIRQLSSLARDNKYEDIWFYLPETGEWIDYGEDVSRDGCIPRPKILPELRPDVKEVSSYHIHPARNLSMGGFYKSEYKNFQGALPPSYEDMEYFLLEKAELKQFGIKLKESVVVDLGGYWVVNFETSDIDKVKNCLKDYENIVNKLQDYGSLANSHVTKYYSTYRSNKNNLKEFEVLKKELIQDFEKKAAELGIDIKYYFLCFNPGQHTTPCKY